MIIDYPDNNCRRFFITDNIIFGPVDSNLNYQAVSVELSLKEEQWLPKKGIYGENDIIHSSFEGRVNYYPIMADCIPYPNAAYPRGVTMPVKDSSPPYVDGLYGFACPDVGALVYRSSNVCTQHAIRRISSTQWKRIQLSIARPTNKDCYVYEMTYSITRWLSSTEVEVQIVGRNSVWGIGFTDDFFRDWSCQTIFDFPNKVSRWSNTSTYLRRCKLYTTDPSRVQNPQGLSAHLDTFINDLMNREFPIPEMNYGELAARAVKQRRCIDTNIYAFLRDIPNAKDLIPKLKNLTKLKTHAGNFLAVKYGILPTIDDLKKIVSAFERRKPYLDRYGHAIYNASNIVNQSTSLGTLTLTQYIKVAVANEDDQFQRLLDELDKVGLGLTFENVWDLIKYSFVLDWFVDVGGLLERVDENLRLLRYNIPYVTMSRKKTVLGELPLTKSLPLVGPIEWRYYHRWTDSHCPLPPLTLSTSPTVSRHWLEAGALIIQRTK